VAGDRKRQQAVVTSGMSEYQYYEFAAVDRPLADIDMAALRTVSTRGTITPLGFSNPT
jgi:hypothetical protein